MNALVFKPSGESIGKFEITSIEELPEKLTEFLATGVRTPLHSYVEAGGQSWTIIGLNPLNLREGNVARRMAKSQRARHQEVESAIRETARRRMMVGLCLCLGGIVLTGGSYAFASSLPHGGPYIVANGAIGWGAIMFFTNLARLKSK